MRCVILCWSKISPVKKIMQQEYHITSEFRHKNNLKLRCDILIRNIYSSIVYPTTIKDYVKPIDLRVGNTSLQL